MTTDPQARDTFGLTSLTARYEQRRAEVVAGGRPISSKVYGPRDRPHIRRSRGIWFSMPATIGLGRWTTLRNGQAIEFCVGLNKREAS